MLNQKPHLNVKLDDVELATVASEFEDLILPPQLDENTAQDIRIAYTILNVFVYKFEEISRREVIQAAIDYLRAVRDQLNVRLTNIDGIIHAAERKLGKEP